MRINHATMNRALTWWINNNLTPYAYRNSVVIEVRYDNKEKEFVVTFAPVADAKAT